MTAAPPSATAQVRRAFVALLAVSTVAGGAAGVFFYSVDAPAAATARAAVLSVASGALAYWVHRTARLRAAAHIILTLLLLATLTSAWVRGTTTSMLPLLVAPCPLATTLVGGTAGRGWLAASVGVLVVAILRNPGDYPSLEVALAVNACLAMIVVGGVTLAFQAMTTRQQAHLAQANLDLTEKEHAAQLANRAKSTFLATMSHEIRTPLNAVIGLAELLGDRPLPEVDRHHAKRIREAGGLLLDLLDGVLDLSRIESGATEVELQPTPAAAIVESVVLALGRHAEAAGVILTMQVDPRLPEGILTDPKRLRQILVNLVGNALKFTREGTVTTTLQRGAEAEGEVVWIDVTDTGVGIPEGARDRIFEEFRQADEGRDRAFGGSGLGLAISRRIAALLGGSLVLLRTEEGQGSTFRLTLPLRPAALPPLPPKPAPSSPPTTDAESAAAGWLHVLVVDDDPVNRTVLEAQLEHLDCTVETATDGRGAVDRLRDASRALPDVVLMDQQMPEMDGLEATRVVRSLGLPVPIVAITANAFAEDREACLDAGMDAFLPKPISRDDLRRALTALTQVVD